MQVEFKSRTDSKHSVKIMLSGFDAESEKNYLANIIQRLNGKYLSSPSSPQAYLPECTHIVCKKPNRSEKYLAGCAAGKWILNPYFVHDSGSQGSWVDEKDYEWGNGISKEHSTFLQKAPKRWREAIKVKKESHPFRNWNVGLVMKQSHTQAYARILEAGEGSAVNITPWLSNHPAPDENLRAKLSQLTHVLVQPYIPVKFNLLHSTKIHCLKADYLALFLLQDPSPSPEKHSLFRRKKIVTHSTKTTDLGQSEETGIQSFGRGVSANVPRDSSKKITLNQNNGVSRIGGTSKDSELYRQTGSKVSKALFSSQLSGKANVVISGVNVRPLNKLGNPATVKLVRPTVWSKTAPGNSHVAVKRAAKSGTQSKGSRAAADNTFQNHRLKSATLQSSGSAESTVAARKEKSFKRHFTEEFYAENQPILHNFALENKLQNTPFSIVNSLFPHHAHEKNEINISNKKPSRPFSRDVVTSLEACLELNYKYRYKNFLHEVSRRVDVTTFPTPDVIYVVMKAILLDTEDPAIAKSAYTFLTYLLKLHPPQDRDIKSLKLYHKAMTVLTVSDTSDESPIMKVIASWQLSSYKEDWSEWSTRDQVLGTHWSFYSRVFNLAIRRTEPKRTRSSNGNEGNRLSTQKLKNAVLLIQFLTKLVERDYEDVIFREVLPPNQPLIQCLISDLLWPSLTGLEPWFRRPSANLSDLVSLYRRAVVAYLSHRNDDASSEHTSESEDSEVDNAFDDEESSGIILCQMSRIITVTASWCVFCDTRQKEHSRRIAARSFEQELIKCLHFELEDCPRDVLELALEYLPSKIRLEVNASLVLQLCSDVLLADTETDADEPLSLKQITAVYMRLVPLLPGDSEKSSKSTTPDKSFSEIQIKSSSNSPNSTNGAFKVNKRNSKGETPLHLACRNNKPDTVRQLLQQQGINPNLTDYAGWTALGEACSHGSIECVGELLKLSAKTFPGNGSPLGDLKIDLTLCPMEGQTPLHDALGNDHLDIARLLLDKGGHHLLEKVDAEGKTPLDYCISTTARDSILDYARLLARKETERLQKKKQVVNNQDPNKSPLMTVPDAGKYEKVIPQSSSLSSEAWLERVTWYVAMTRMLVLHHVNSCCLVKSCLTINNSDEKEPAVLENEPISYSRKDACADVSTHEVQIYANEVIYCMRWKECWELYRTHIKRLLGDDEKLFENAMKDFPNPVPPLVSPKTSQP